MGNRNKDNEKVNDRSNEATDEEMQKSYHNIIRQMITNENEIRNQRTNWFLVIQGFLVAGCCELYANKCLCQICYLILIISVIGIVTSLSFWHAAWRSEKAIEMVLACWDIFIRDNNRRIKEFPPVIALTKSIIQRYKFSNEKLTENDNREIEIFHQIYCVGKNYKKKKRKICWDSKRNNLDCMLPFKAMPIVFFLAWIIVPFMCFFSIL